MTPKLLDHALLEHTLRDITGLRISDARALRAMQLQAGRKAFIQLFEVTTTKGREYFTMYLANSPIDTAIGRQSEEDYHGLRELHHQAKQRLPRNMHEQYQVIKPVAMGTTPAVYGKHYAFFTMPFVEDHGELTIELYDPGKLSIPYYRFAFEYYSWLTDYNRRMNKSVHELARKMSELQSKFPNQKVDFESQLSRAPEYALLVKQHEDVLLGNAITYELLGKKFPREFQINAGDWMMRPKKHDGFNLFLITLRGGLEEFSSDDEWIQRMVDHKEPVPGMESQAIAFQPFLKNPGAIVKALRSAQNITR